MAELAAEWAWPEDVANPLSRLTLLTSLDLSANELTHLGCDVMASLRSLSELVVADNLVTRLADVSLACAGLRLARLDVSGNRLTQLAVQSLSSSNIHPTSIPRGVHPSCPVTVQSVRPAGAGRS